MIECSILDSAEHVLLVPISLVLWRVSSAGVGIFQFSLVLEKMPNFGIDDPISLALDKRSSSGIEGPNLTGIGKTLWC